MPRKDNVIVYKNQYRSLYISMLSFVLILFVLFPTKASYSYGAFEIQESLQPVLTVAGKITDENGEPLPGVVVKIKSNNKGTISNINGEYSLKISGPNDVLVFSFLGFATQEFAVGNKKIIDVKLRKSETGLDEVVVIGYGEVRKGDLTGSVASIKTESIKELNVATLDGFMQGRAAGVQVTSTDGTPGGDFSVKIRGAASVSAGIEPLYVIDGFPIVGSPMESSGDLSSNMTAVSNPLAGINPSDIESMEILKDASATAIYGARGANGVVLITTKKGKAGKTRLSYDAYAGVQEISKKMAMMSQDEYLFMIEQAYPNQQVLGYIDINTGKPHEKLYSPGAYINWQDKIFRKGNVQNHQLNVSGGNLNNKFNISFGYYGNNGIILNSNFNRYNLRINWENQISKLLKVGINATGSSSISKGKYSGGTISEYSGIIYSALRFRPIMPDYVDDYTDPNFTDLEDLDSQVNTSNPLSFVNDLKHEYKSRSALVNTYAQFNLFKNFGFKTTFGTNLQGGVTNAFYPITTALGRLFDGRAVRQDLNRSTLLNENTLTYRYRKGQHSVNSLAGFTVQKFQSEGVNNKVSDFPIETNGFYNLGAGLSPSIPVSIYDEWSIASFIGRIHYSYKNRYLLTINARRDGSSKFGADNKWATFPSLALAWRVGQEQFMKQINFISDLKFRGSYGVTGNQNIPTYNSLASLSSGVYTFGGSSQTSVYATSLENQNLKWETTRQADLGVDLGLFKDRLNLTVDLYKKKTEDMLIRYQLPSSSGFTTALKNFGAVEQKGLEISLSSQIIRKKDFTWNSSFNISFDRNKVVEIGSSGEYIVDGGGGIGVNITKENYPIGMFYGLVWDGVYQLSDFNYDENLAHENRQYTLKQGVPYTTGFQTTQQPGDIRFRDVSGPDGVPDGVVDAYDRTIIGNPNPKYYGGFSNSFSYKNFDLSIFLNWSYGNDIYNWQRDRFGMPNAGVTFNYFSDVSNFWRIDNQTNEMPRIHKQNQGKRDLNYGNSFMVEDGSFLRLNNITFGYTLPGNTVKRLKVSSTKFFIGLDNIHVWTNYSGYDPEVNMSRNVLAAGQDSSPYPRTKSVRLGMNVVF